MLIKHSKPAWRKSFTTTWVVGISIRPAPVPQPQQGSCERSGGCTTPEPYPPQSPRLAYLQMRTWRSPLRTPAAPRNLPSRTKLGGGQDCPDTASQLLMQPRAAIRAFLRRAQTNLVLMGLVSLPMTALPNLGLRTHETLPNPAQL